MFLRRLFFRLGTSPTRDSTSASPLAKHFAINKKSSKTEEQYFATQQPKPNGPLRINRLGESQSKTRNAEVSCENKNQGVLTIGNCRRKQAFAPDNGIRSLSDQWIVMNHLLSGRATPDKSHYFCILRWASKLYENTIDRIVRYQ